MPDRCWLSCGIVSFVATSQSQTQHKTDYIFLVLVLEELDPAATSTVGFIFPPPYSCCSYCSHCYKTNSNSISVLSPTVVLRESSPSRTLLTMTDYLFEYVTFIADLRWPANLPVVQACHPTPLNPPITRLQYLPRLPTRPHLPQRRPRPSVFPRVAPTLSIITQ